MGNGGSIVFVVSCHIDDRAIGEGLPRPLDAVNAVVYVPSQDHEISACGRGSEGGKLAMEIAEDVEQCQGRDGQGGLVCGLTTPHKLQAEARIDKPVRAGRGVHP